MCVCGGREWRFRCSSAAGGRELGRLGRGAGWRERRPRMRLACCVCVIAGARRLVVQREADG